VLFSLASRFFLVYCNADCSVLSKINKLINWYDSCLVFDIAVFTIE